MVKYKKNSAFRKPALVRVREVGDSASDYEGALHKAGVKPAAYEELFGLMVGFRDFPPNEAQFKKHTASSSRFIARRFLKMFGERIWGDDRKYIRSGLPNGGFRYTPANPDRNVGKLVDAMASAFREMKRKMFRPADGSTIESEEQVSLDEEDDEEDEDGEEDKNDEEDEQEVGDEETEADNPAEDEDQENAVEPEEVGTDAGLSRHRRFEKKKSRLSTTVEYEEGEVHDEEEDSSSRLRHLEAHRASTRQVDEDMPYDFDRPVRGVTYGQQQAINDFMVQLDAMKGTAPAMYHRICLQVLRHYRDGRPI